MLLTPCSLNFSPPYHPRTNSLHPRLRLSPTSPLLPTMILVSQLFAIVSLSCIFLSRCSHSRPCLTSNLLFFFYVSTSSLASLPGKTSATSSSTESDEEDVSRLEDVCPGRMKTKCTLRESFRWKSWERSGRVAFFLAAHHVYITKYLRWCVLMYTRAKARSDTSRVAAPSSTTSSHSARKRARTTYSTENPWRSLILSLKKLVSSWGFIFKFSNCIEYVRCIHSATQPRK